MPTNNSIAIDDDVKESLERLKAHPRQSFNEVIKKLIGGNKHE